MNVFVVLRNEWIEVSDTDSELSTSVHLVTVEKEKALAEKAILDKLYATYGEIAERELV